MKSPIFSKKTVVFEPLSTENLRSASQFLADRDDALRLVFEKYGPPPLWQRPASFATLVLLILEQQVSLSSARAAFRRLETELGGSVEPLKILSLSDETMRTIGFSRQKTGYARGLAEAILNEKLILQNLENLPDEAVKVELKKLKGIGDWTADIFLSECLLRPDVLPRGDIAMLESIRVLKNLEKRPSHDHFSELTTTWQPFRSVGTRLLWVFYLKEIRPTAGFL